MAVTLLAVDVPIPQHGTGAYDPTLGPLGSRYVIGGGVSRQLSDPFNENAGRLDMAYRWGGGFYGVCTGLAISHVSGLDVSVAAGQAIIDTLVDVRVAQTRTLDNSARNHLWVRRDGSITHRTDTASPGSDYAYLGSVLMAAGTISGAVETAGVIYDRGGVPVRFTADVTEPTDTPPATLVFFTVGTAKVWWWDGTAYHEFDPGGAGAVISQLTVNPANGTNTVSAADAAANSAILLTGGSATSQYTLSIDIGSVVAGKTWEITNRTSLGVLIVRAGSGLASCFLGQGSANDQRGLFLYDGSEIRRVAKDDPSYISRTITATLTATRGQIEARLNTIGAQTGAQTVDVPLTTGFEGQVTAWHADPANYPLTVEAAGETEPEAIVILLPGETGQTVQDAAGKQRVVPSRPRTRRVVVDMGSDANKTLSASEAVASIIEITDTGPVLTADRDVIWGTQQTADHHEWRVRNRTAKTLRFKTSGGGGVYVAPGKSAPIYCDGTNMVPGGGHADASGSLAGGLIFASTATATVANTTTEGSLIGGGVGVQTLPANTLTVGKSVRLQARGLLSTAAVPGNLTIAFKLGSTTVVTTGAFAVTGALTDLLWELDVLLTCRTVGGTGTVFAQGMFRYLTAALGNLQGSELVATGTTTIDTTASQLVDSTADWATADASNSIRGTNCTIELLG